MQAMKLLTWCMLVTITVTSLSDVIVRADIDDADSSEAHDAELPYDDDYDSEYDQDNDDKDDDDDDDNDDDDTEKGTQQESDDAGQVHINLPNGCHGQKNGLEIHCRKSDSSKLLNSSLFPEKSVHLTIEHSVTPIEILDRVNMTGLHTLHLTSVGLRYISDDAFVNMGSLRKLTLANNSITSVSSRTFQGLLSLEVLVLEGNPLHVIPAGTFTASNLPLLWELKLDRCRLYSVEKDWISDLKRLNVLYMNDNYLPAVPDMSDTTSGLTNLTLLYLNHNRIVDITNQSLLLPGSLTELWLRNNLISRVQLELSSETRLSLQEIHLGHNLITVFDTKGLENQKQLQTLDLQHNLLTNIKPESLPLSKLSMNRILISDNPWNCSGCSNIWLFTDRAVIRYNDTNARCSGPGSYANLSVFDPSVHRACPQSTTFNTSPQSKVAVAAVVIFMFVVIIILAFIIIVRRKKRYNHERDGLTWRGSKSTRRNTPNPPTVSYKQMQDISRYSITEDD